MTVGCPRKDLGFTLIEVTLVLVIGIIIIAGATLQYNQTKIGAGNTRASLKVLALQQLAEEFAASNQGTYPTIDTVRVLWKRKRPDDYLKSPWGGQVGPSANDPSDLGGERGIFDSSTATGAHSAWLQSTGTGGSVPGLNTLPVSALPLSDPSQVGALSYDLNDVGGSNGGGNPQNNSATASIYDVITNSNRTVRGYAVWIFDQSGQYPNFPTGGKEQ